MYVPPQAVKGLIEAYMAKISARDFDALPAFFSSNATWWVSGNPARVPQAGTRPAAQQLQLLPMLVSKFTTYEYNIQTIVAEGPVVMVDGQAVGKGPKDLVYVNNITSTYFINSDHKIQEVRENPVHSEIDWLLQWFKDHPNA